MVKKLSKRETEMAVLLLKGYTNKKISKTLNVSLSTVKRTLEHIYLKLGVDVFDETINRRIKVVFALLENLYSIKIDL